MELNQLKTIEQIIEYAQVKGGGKDAVMERKSNENLDITEGADWYSAAGVVSKIKDLTAQRGGLLSRLQEGFEGSNLPDSYPIPYDVTNEFMLGKTVWVDEARPAFNNTALTDASRTISQVSFILQFGITDEMIHGSTDKQVYDYVISKASKAAVSTIEGCIINGDTETGATGNVNSDDQAPATTFGTAAYHSLKIDNGIRESAINNSATVNVGAFDSDDLNLVRAEMGPQYMNRMSELLWIAEPTTFLKMMTDDAIKLMINTRQQASIDGGTPAPFGIELISHDLVPKTEADGKVSATGSNNTLGQVLCVFKPAIRWGFGRDVQIEVERVQGYGFEVTCTMRFGFTILDRTLTCAAGINVTVAS